MENPFITTRQQSIPLWIEQCISAIYALAGFSAAGKVVICFFFVYLSCIPESALAQVTNTPKSLQLPLPAQNQVLEVFPDALQGVELYYQMGRFGEVDLTLRKYFGAKAEIKDTLEKLIVRESLTGMVAEHPLLRLQSLKVDTGLVNVRCAGYPGAYVKVATYVGKVKLMSPMMGGYDMTLGYCCWDMNLNMVNIPGMREGKHPGLSLNLHLPEMASMDTNTAPVFQYVPVLNTCMNQLVTFNSSAYDADRDSLAYEFFPLEDYLSVNGAPNPAAPVLRPGQFINVTFPGGRPPFLPIAYAEGYYFDHPMKGKQMIMDAQTGMITMKPEQVGDYLIGIAVKEYRNRKLLGIVKRVIKIKVVS